MVGDNAPHLPPPPSVGRSTFRLRINWLPVSRASSVAVARATEAAGFEGLGVCDSPRALEVYGAVETCLAATTRLVVGTNVTNPVTRHWSVHAAAVRAMHEHGAGRSFLGMGTGDSAVRTDGGRPAPLAAVGACIERIRDGVGSELTVNVAAGGPRGAAVAARVADGVVAGVGTSLPALAALLDAAGPPVRPRFARWATVRVAVGDDAADVARLRRAMVPRAVSAARFNLAAGTAGRDIPESLRAPLEHGFAGYDFAWHGRSGDNPNARLFASRPDIETFLVDRFAVVGAGPEVAARLAALRDGGFDGAFLSILFEDPLPEIARLGAALAAGGLVTPAPTSEVS